MAAIAIALKLIRRTVALPCYRPALPRAVIERYGCHVMPKPRKSLKRGGADLAARRKYWEIAAPFGDQKRLRVCGVASGESLSALLAVRASFLSYCRIPKRVKEVSIIGVGISFYIIMKQLTMRRLD